MDCDSVLDKKNLSQYQGSNEEAGNIDVNLESGELYLKLSNLHHRMKSKSGAGGVRKKLTYIFPRTL